MKYSIDWLKEQPSPDYFFFWGHTQKQEGVIDKSCFSQWFKAPFTVKGETYPTAEHWMMAKKAYLFDDVDSYAKIFTVDNPAVAKNIGRAVKHFDAATWSEHAYSFVVEGNYHKFSQHEDLKRFLLYTGNKIIVEASPSDLIWGIGLAQDQPEATNPFKWKGTNLLGFALMEVRDQLKEAS